MSSPPLSIETPGLNGAGDDTTDGEPLRSDWRNSTSTPSRPGRLRDMVHDLSLAKMAVAFFCASPGCPAPLKADAAREFACHFLPDVSSQQLALRSPQRCRALAPLQPNPLKLNL
jgi:hypothetical protein